MSNPTSSAKSATRPRSRSKSETRRSTAGTSKPIVEEDEKAIKQMESHFNQRWDLVISLDDISSMTNNVRGHQR